MKRSLSGTYKSRCSKSTALALGVGLGPAVASSFLYQDSVPQSSTISSNQINATVVTQSRAEPLKWYDQTAPEVVGFSAAPEPLASAKGILSPDVSDAAIAKMSPELQQIDEAGGD